MITILHLLVAALGLIIYYLRPRWLFLYWLIVLPFIKPILCFFTGINDMDEAHNMIFGGYFMHLNLIVLFDSIIFRRNRVPSLRGLLVTMAILVFYLFFQAMATNGGLQYAYYNIKDVLIAVLPLLILVVNKDTRPDIKELYFLVWVIIILESVAVLLNLYGIRFYVATYQYLLVYRETMMTGTFLTSQLFGNFMTTLYLYICIDFFSRRKISFTAFAVLSVLSLFCILSSGSKMCFLLSYAALVMATLLYQRKHFLLLLTILLIGYMGVISLQSFNGRDISSNEGVNRMVNGLAEFVQRKQGGYDDNSTFGISEKLLDAYFWETPLFGNGLSSNGNDYSYSINSGINEVNQLKADARLAFVIVDIGLFGLVFYLLFYLKVFKTIAGYLPKKIKKSLIIVFVYYLLFTITESGFWDAFAYPMVYIYYFAIIREYSQANKSCVHSYHSFKEMQLPRIV